MLPQPSPDHPQRVAFAESLLIDKKKRVLVGAKNPPPVVSFVVGDYQQADSVDAATLNQQATMCAVSTSDNVTNIWSWPLSSLSKANDEQVATKLYNSLFVPHSNQQIMTLPTGRSTLCLDFSPDSPILLSGTSRGEVALWSLEKESKLISYVGHSNRTPVWNVCWAPAGFYFSTSSGDSSARIWRTDIPYPIRQFTIEGSNHVHFVKWHPTTEIVAIGASNSVSVYDVSSGKPIFQFNDFKGCTALEFSPTGYLLAAANDECLTVWETATGACIFKFNTYNPILGLAWSNATGAGVADGGVKGPAGTAGVGHSVLVSVEQSGKIRLWDKLSVSKPSVCELNLPQSIRPLHMHFTPRNLLACVGVRDVPNMSRVYSLGNTSVGDM